MLNYISICRKSLQENVLEEKVINFVENTVIEEGSSFLRFPAEQSKKEMDTSFQELCAVGRILGW